MPTTSNKSTSHTTTARRFSSSYSWIECQRILLVVSSTTFDDLNALSMVSLRESDTTQVFTPNILDMNSIFVLVIGLRSLVQDISGKWQREQEQRPRNQVFGQVRSLGRTRQRELGSRLELATTASIPKDIAAPADCTPL